MSDLMQKFLDGELSEFEAERLERELEQPETSVHFLAMAEKRHAELEVQAAKSMWRRSVEYWVAWFGRASLAAVTQASLAVKLTTAVAVGAGSGAAGYALLQSGWLDQSLVPLRASVAAPAHKIKQVKKQAVVPAAVLLAQRAKKKEHVVKPSGVAVDVVRGGGNTEGEPILENYDPGPSKPSLSAEKEDLTIEVHLDNSRYVSVQIVDAKGSLTKTVHTGQLPKGNWFFFLNDKDKDWRNMPAGAYFVEVNVGQQRLRKDFSVSGGRVRANGA